MEFIISQTFSILIASLLLFMLLKKAVTEFNFRRKYSLYPPGPKPKFLIGNMLDFPQKQAAEKFLEWGRKYDSDIIHIEALGIHIVGVNTLKVADELLERRAKKYSDRPEIPMIKLIEMGWNTVFLGYGDEWRHHRKICQQHFNYNASKVFQPTLITRVSDMFHGLLESPEKYDFHNKMLSISIAMEMMYGYDVKSLEDRAIKAAETFLALSVPLLMPGTLINIVPFLRHVPAWFPGANSRKQAAEVVLWTREMQRIPMEFVREKMAEGTAPPSFVSHFLEKRCTAGSSEEEEKVCLNIASTIYGASSDTTIAATGTFFHVIAINPDVQRKAQAEIDRVVGTHRLPDFGDRISLPYVEAIYREVMRYNPPLHIGIMHGLSEDDYFEEYFLPRGTHIFANIWAMTHDERVYPDPFEFNPERFFDARGELNDDDRVLAYGFGRKVCVGKHVASSTMWLTIVSILACFTIGKAKDEFGNDIEIDGEYEDLGLFSHKKPFKCAIIPRSDRSRRLIEEAMLSK